MNRTRSRGPALNGATAVVLGYGRSGKAAAALLAREGARPRVTDTKDATALAVAPGSVPGGDAWLGRMDEAVLAGADLVIASPGVPPTNPVLAAALRTGLPVHSELELGWWHVDAPTVAITGTNGKTTTTELVGAMGRAAGRETAVVGNVGTPLSEIAGTSPDLCVVEISSFQLFLCREFAPEVGALLNLTPDHLDWHPDHEHYTESKARLFAHQRASDTAVLNADDPDVMRLASRIPSAIWTFSTRSESRPGTWTDAEHLFLSDDAGSRSVLALADWHLAGRHNVENLLAAAACAHRIGLPDAAIAAGARSFAAMPHRMEIVREANGVTWINDSKSTNPGSLAAALDPERPTLLIAGGVTKGVDFSPLRQTVAAGARVVFLIGEGAPAMDVAWRGAVRTVVAGDLETAVALAAAEAGPGERVLFSPGCSSFDQFKNYAHRGDRFREIVRERVTEGGTR